MTDINFDPLLRIDSILAGRLAALEATTFSLLGVVALSDRNLCTHLLRHLDLQAEVALEMVTAAPIGELARKVFDFRLDEARHLIRKAADMTEEPDDDDSTF